MTSYEQLTTELKEAPLSWLPALLLIIIEQCCKRKVFASPEAMKMAMERHVDRQHSQRVESRNRKEPGS